MKDKLHNNWKKYSIFISSTFRDMDDERDYLKDILIPRLNKELGEFYISVEICDLRSGLNPGKVDEKVREKYILDSCFRFIQECNPFFIGLIGDRYGWIPPYEDLMELYSVFQQKGISLDEVQNKSVTEIEMMLGAFADQEQQAIFCIRKTKEDLSSESLSLNALKENVYQRYGQEKHKGQLIEYTSDESCTDLVGKFEQFGDDLFHALFEKILLYSRIYSVESNCITRNINRFIFDKHLHYREPSFSHYYDKVFAIGKPVIITGFEGYGKSTYLAHLYQQRREQALFSNEIILFYSFDIADVPHQLSGMLKYWIKQTGVEVFGVDECEENNYLFIEFFKRCVGKLEEKGLSVTIIIDSYDKADSYLNAYAASLSWIPSSVNYVVSTALEWKGLYLSDDRNILPLMPFTKFDMKAYILSLGYTDLTENIIERVLQLNYKVENEVEITPYNSPMLNKLMIQYLTDFNGTKYKEFRKTTNYYDAIESYRMERIPDYPLFLEQAFKVYFQISDELMSSNSNLLLCMLAFSRSGLRESDLQHICTILGQDWDPRCLNVVANKFSEYISYSSDTRKWNFTYDFCRRALQIVLIKKPKVIEWIYSTILRHLLTLPFTDALVNQELFYYFIRGGIVDKSAEIINNNIEVNHELIRNALTVVYEGFANSHTFDTYAEWMWNLLAYEKYRNSSLAFYMAVADSFDEVNNVGLIIPLSQRIFKMLVDKDFEEEGMEAVYGLVILAKRITHFLIKEDLMTEAVEYIDYTIHYQSELSKFIDDEKFLEALDLEIKHLYDTIQKKNGNFTEETKEITNDEEQNEYDSVSDVSIDELEDIISELQFELSMSPDDLGLKAKLAKNYAMQAKILYEIDEEASEAAHLLCLKCLSDVYELSRDKSDMHNVAHYIFDLGKFYHSHNDYIKAISSYMTVKDIDKSLYEQNETYENKRNLIAIIHLLAKCYCEAHLPDEMGEEIKQCKELKGEIEDLKEFCEEHSCYANLYKQSNILSEAYEEFDAICSRIYDALSQGKGNAFLYLFIENLIESAEILCLVQETTDGLDRLSLAMEISKDQIEKAESCHADETYIEDFRLLYCRAYDTYKSFTSNFE